MEHSSPQIAALPDRATVFAYLEDLVAKKRMREEAADWATQFLRGDYDGIRIKDWPVLRMLEALAAVDVKESPTEFLCSAAEIKGWSEQLKQAPHEYLDFGIRTSFIP